MRYTIANRVVGVLLFVPLLIVAGVWQVGVLVSRLRRAGRDSDA